MKKWQIVSLSLLVVLILAGYFYYFTFLNNHFHTLIQWSQYGNTLAGFGAIVSTIALVLVAISLFIQSEELRVAKTELEKLKTSHEKQTLTMERTAKLNGYSSLANIGYQGSTLAPNLKGKQELFEETLTYRRKIIKLLDDIEKENAQNPT